MSDNPNNIAPDAPTDSIDSTVDVDAAKRDYRLLKILALSTLVLASAGSMTMNLVDPDLWGHVAYGRELLAEGELPRTATHTFTAEGYRWINHENLAEIAFAVGFDTLGVRGMLVAKCLLGLAILSLMYLVARRNGARALVAWTFLLLVASNLYAFFLLRPQLLSFTCCALMVVLLDQAFRDWRKKSDSAGVETDRLCRVRWAWLAIVPLLMIVWVNSHGGFVAGLCILGALLFGRIIEALFVDRGRATFTAAGLAIVGAFSLSTVLVNPYGFGLVEWLVEALSSPRPEITEWAAPKRTDPIFVPLVLIIGASAAAWAFTDRRRDWTQLVILALVTWQACSHVRHVAFLALLTGFWTTPHVAAVLSRARNRAASGLPVVRLGASTKWAAVGIFLAAIVIQSYALADRLTKLPVVRRMYPVDAFDFMAAHDINGRMVVSFNWAQYALAAFPDSTVSFDGRFRTCYPQEIVDMNFDFLLGTNLRAQDSSDPEGPVASRRFRSPNSGPINGTTVLEFGDPEIVIVDRNYRVPVDVMKSEAEKPDCPWCLLYQDSVAQVWGLKRVFDSQDSDRYLPAEQRLIGEAPRPFAVQWPAMPIRRTPAVAQGETQESEVDI